MLLNLTYHMKEGCVYDCMRDSWGLVVVVPRLSLHHSSRQLTDDDDKVLEVVDDVDVVVVFVGGERQTSSQQGQLFMSCRW